MSEQKEDVVEVVDVEIEEVEQELSPVDEFIIRHDNGEDVLDEFKSLADDLKQDIYQELESQVRDFRSVQVWYEINKLNVLTGRGLHKLRSLISKHDGCDDWEQVLDIINAYSPISQCNDCNEWEFDDYLLEPMHCHAVCRVCLDDDYRWSDYYDRYIYSSSAVRARDHDGTEVLIHEDDDDFHYDNDIGEWVHCDYEQEEQGVILNYHSSKRYQQPIPDTWTAKNKRYFGVELEVECRVDREDSAKRLHQVVNEEKYGHRLFFENDGSLNGGYEIISQPMSLPMHRELWGLLQKPELIKGLRSHNTTTCGLHVHVSRYGMTSLQIAKIVTFVNKPENEDLIRAIARRYAEGYCKIKSKKIGRANKSEDRYEAVNITSSKTIEFRIFKGSLKYESVISAIEFSNALVEFCKPSNTSINELTADKFIAFCEKQIPDETKIMRPYIAARIETA